MATANNVVDNLFGSDAEWRTYCQAVEDALLASGFLAVAADTGQLDIASATRPAAGAYAGYRIYHAVDDLAATHPIVLKVEYGVATTTSRPKIQASVSPGSNGAGTLNSPALTAATFVNASADGSGSCRIFGSGLEEASAWVYLYDPGSTVNSGFLCVGRLISVEDAEPKPTMRWINISSGGGTIMSNGNFSDGAASWSAASLTFTQFYPDLAHALNTGGDINNTNIYQATMYRDAETLTFPVVTGKAAELPFVDPDSSAFTVDIWGTAHTFVPLPQGAISGVNQRAAVPWE